MKNTALNSAPNIRKLAALPAANARERNSRIGSIGSRARSSQSDERDRRARPPAASAPTTSALPQPALLPRTSPQTMPERGAADQRQPGRHRAGPGSAALLDPRQHQRNRGQPDRHVQPEDPLPRQSLRDRAADTGPPTTASPVMPPKIPNARPRRSGGKAAINSASDDRRDHRGAGALHGPRGDQQADVGRQRARRRGRPRTTPSLARTARRRPNRSPSAAPVISSTAKLRP